MGKPQQWGWSYFLDNYDLRWWFRLGIENSSPGLGPLVWCCPISWVLRAFANVYQNCGNGYIVYCCNFLLAQFCSCSSGLFPALSFNSRRVWGWSGYCLTIVSSAVCQELVSNSCIRSKGSLRALSENSSKVPGSCFQANTRKSLHSLDLSELA